MEKDKFEGHKPLIEYPSRHYATKYDLQYYNFEEPKETDLYDLYRGMPVTTKIPLYVFGIKAQPKEFKKYDFLDLPDGPAFVIHDRVLKIFQEMCPDDFQRFDMIIKNLDSKDPPFENKEFHIINVTNRIKALDMEKSEFHKSPNGILFPTKRIFKDEDCWEGNLLAREELESCILFHPKLAKKFRRSKGIQFLSDSEAPC
jgi:hypothetical protein